MGEREKQYSGMISYKKLFDLMEKRNIKKRDLREKYNISPTIVNRLNNNSNVTVDTIMYLCEILDCQPGDIVEYIQDETWKKIYMCYITYIKEGNQKAATLK